MDFKNCCRLCLREGEKACISPSSILELNNGIPEFFGFTISSTDDCTKLICHECASKITAFKMYQTMVIRNQSTIKEYQVLQQKLHEIKTEVENLVELEDDDCVVVADETDEISDNEKNIKVNVTARKSTSAIPKLPRMRKCRVLLEKLSQNKIERLVGKSQKIVKNKLNQKAALSLALRKILQKACEDVKVNSPKDSTSPDKETIQQSPLDNSANTSTISIAEGTIATIDLSEIPSPIEQDPADFSPHQIRSNHPNNTNQIPSIYNNLPENHELSILNVMSLVANENIPSADNLVISNVCGADSIQGFAPVPEVPKKKPIVLNGLTLNMLNNHNQFKNLPPALPPMISIPNHMHTAMSVPQTATVAPVQMATVTAPMVNLLPTVPTNGNASTNATTQIPRQVKVLSVSDINKAYTNAQTETTRTEQDESVGLQPDISTNNPSDVAAFTIRLIRCKNEIQIKIHNASTNAEVHFAKLSLAQRQAVRKSLIQTGNLNQINTALKICQPDDYSKALLKSLDLYC